MSAARLALSTACMLALGACSLVGGGDSADAGGGPTGAPQPPGTTTVTAPPPAAAPTNPEDLALAELLLDEPPLPGFRRADDRLGAGVLDLEAAGRAESDVDAERALLETRHFVRGVSRAWIDDDEDVVYVAVYTFRDPRDAALYLQDGTETLLARGAIGFAVPEVTGGFGFTTVDDDARGAFTSHAVAFASRERWALVVVGTRRSGRTPVDARLVAAAQAARLG